MMKTLPQVLPFLLLPFLSFSQNWNLISSARTLNFGTAGNEQVVETTIAVDFVLMVGADSVFMVGPKTLEYFPAYPYAVLVGNLLADSIVQRTNGLYEFHYLPTPEGYGAAAPFFMQSRAQVGDTWVFRDSITAEVISVEAQTVLGVADSVKTIALSDGGTVRISKNFGILQWLDHTLIGLQGANVGTQLPDNLDWYDWSPGEVFQYEIFSGNNYDISYKTWTKYTLQAKSVTPQAITFTVRRLTKRETYNFSNLVLTVYEDVVEPLAIADPTGVDFPGYQAISSCAFRSCSYQLSGSGVAKILGQVTPPCANTPQSSARFETGLGRTAYFFNYNSVSGGYKTDEHLIGYQKTGQTQQGTVYPNSFYNAATGISDPTGAPGPNVFPNPARDFITVSCEACGTIQTVEVYNGAGQIVLAVQSHESTPVIFTGNFPAGVYLLKIVSADKTWTRRLVLESR